MHPLFSKADALSSQAIAAAIEVHRIKGPGLIESIYEKCMMREFELRGIPAANQIRIVDEYKGFQYEQELRLDIILDGCLILELKSVQQVPPIFKAKLLSYMKLLDKPVGLLLNFHETLLKDGISRLILPGADIP